MSSVHSHDGTDSVASSLREFRFPSTESMTYFDLFFKFGNEHVKLESKISSNNVWSQNILYKYSEVFRLRFSLISNLGIDESTSHKSRIGLGFEIGN